jgi:hypothetical protein
MDAVSQAGGIHKMRGRITLVISGGVAEASLPVDMEDSFYRGELHLTSLCGATFYVPKNDLGTAERYSSLPSERWSSRVR